MSALAPTKLAGIQKTNPFPPLTPDEHFARASGEARLALIWEKLKEIQEAIGELKTP